VPTANAKLDAWDENENKSALLSYSKSQRAGQKLKDKDIFYKKCHQIPVTAIGTTQNHQ